MITSETQQAIDRGLEYLARTQSRDGAWRHAGYMGQYPAAMTALSGIALLANGNTALSSVELHRILGKRTPEIILRTLIGRQIYVGIKPIANVKEQDK